MGEYPALYPPTRLEDGVDEVSATDSFGALAKFMSLDKDNDLIAFRKFKKLTLYSLLAQQHRLIVLENNISTWEKKVDSMSDDEEDGEIKQTGGNQNLDEMLQDAQKQLKDYHEALLRGSQILKLPPLSNRLVEYFRQLSRGLLNELRPIVHGEGISDLTAIAASEKGSIHKYISKNRNLEQVFLKPHNDGLPYGMRLYSEKHVRNTETVLINVTFFILVMIPIVALSYVRSKGIKLVIIAIMIILTSVIASGLSDNSHRSGLGVIVGYTAIVVVFLSNSL